MNAEKTRSAISGYPMLLLGILFLAAAVTSLVFAIRHESPILLIPLKIQAIFKRCMSQG